VGTEDHAGGLRSGEVGGECKWASRVLLTGLTGFED
jgi:hypothetical protein